MQVHSVAPEQQTGNISIKGHVVDNKGEVLIGVTVMVKGTNNGVITDMNGNFTIAAKTVKHWFFPISDTKMWKSKYSKAI